MQELWTEEPQKVRAELDELIATQMQLTLFQQGQTPRKLRAAAIKSNPDGDLLLLGKNEPFPAPPNASLILYHPTGQPMRGFSAAPLLETATQMAVALPGRIIQIQRRQHPRLEAGSRSRVTFTRHGSQAINNGSIKDVSLAGASLAGPFSEHITKGDRLSPLTMTLRLHFGDYEETLTVSEATVRRRKELTGGEMELGVHFSLKKKEQNTLETYLSLRTLELDALTQARSSKV